VRRVVSVSLCATVLMMPAATVAGTLPSAAAPGAPSASTPLPAMHAVRLIGSSVWDAQGRRIGWIDDLVLDINNRRVHCALLAVPRLWNVWAEVFAHPLSRFGRSAGGTLVFDSGRDRAAVVATLDDIGSSGWSRPPERLVRASTLLGMPVVDQRGAKAGEIHDLVIDAASGQILHAVIAFGPATGGHARLARLPIDRLRYGARSEPAVLLREG
jgi:sporulation protein YlmC with PRC-barrel domain